MHKAIRMLVPLAAAAVPLAMIPGAAFADTGTQYQATLNPINHSSGSGMLTLTLNGNSATIDENWTGLAPSFGGAAYPHVQHIHGGAKGQCPTTAADTNGDGVISTTEGAPAYGGIDTTLSVSGSTSPAAGTNLKIAPSGPSLTYHRVITLSAGAVRDIQNGTAVIVVHGLDPATLSKKAQGEKSDLVPSLPLAATSPALCGALTAMPAGGVATGYSANPSNSDTAMVVLGGGLVAAGAASAGLALRRRRVSAN